MTNTIDANGNSTSTDNPTKLQVCSGCGVVAGKPIEPGSNELDGPGVSNGLCFKCWRAQQD